jgi:Glycosyltransferase family 87
LTATPSLSTEALLDDIEGVPDVVSAPARARQRRRRRRTMIVAVVVIFLLTRSAAGYMSDHPQAYGKNRADGTGDVNLYDYFTWEMRHTGSSAYRDLHMEYPPGAIPVMMIPRYVRIISYRTEFIMLMVAFDALGLCALARIAKRGGTWWGFWAWMVLVPLLGIVSYTRFDMVVAVALVWAIERAMAGKWKQVGALLGVGAAVKLVPFALVPLVFFVVPRGQRRGFLLATFAVIGIALLPFAFQLGAMYDSVWLYHSERGVQAESLWGAGLMVARWVWSYPVAIVASHRAYDAQADIAPALKALSNAVCLGVLGFCAYLASRTRRDDIGRLSLLLFGALTVLIGFGSVFSPQYLLWVIALGSAALALNPRAAALPVAVLGVAVALAHIEFPMWFWDLLFYDKGGALIVLAVRDVLTVSAGVLALWACRRPSPSVLASTASDVRGG